MREASRWLCTAALVLIVSRGDDDVLPSSSCDARFQTLSFLLCFLSERIRSQKEHFETCFLLLLLQVLQMLVPFEWRARTSFDATGAKFTLKLKVDTSPSSTYEGSSTAWTLCVTMRVGHSPLETWKILAGKRAWCALGTTTA